MLLESVLPKQNKMGVSMDDDIHDPHDNDDNNQLAQQ